MSVQQLPARRSQANPSKFPGSVSVLPDSTYAYNPAEDDDSLPLPDHFPEPYVEPAPEQTALRTSAVLETGETLVYCSTQHVVNKNSNDGGEVDEAKEGLRRITDKYAAPGMLLRNGSVSSDVAYTSSLTPKETLPSSPTPSITLSPSPVSPSAACNPYPVVMNGDISTGSKISSHPSSPTYPNSNYALTQNAGVRNGGSIHRLTPQSVSAFSDASSDISDVSPSPALTPSVGGGSSTSGGVGGVGGGRYQSISGISMGSLGEGVSEQDVQQVEMFYKSHKTEVTVCHSLANLYIGSVTINSPASSLDPNSAGGLSLPASGSDSWEFVSTGIPLIVLDSGDHHRTRQMSIVLAEKGTGFTLWKDVVSHLTRYACPHANFHTLRMSADNNKLAGLSFDDSKAAADFATTIIQMTSDPEDELLMLSKKGKKKKKKQETKKKIKFKPPKKTDISQPCCFQHVTKLERPQMTGVLPLPPNSFPPAPSGSVSSLSDVFQDRLTLSMSRARSQSSELSEGSTAPSDH